MPLATNYWQKLGLTNEEYATIAKRLERVPNELETALFAVMWSEHCGYKHSRRQLRKFPTTGPFVLQGPGENAGVLDIGDNQAIVMKIESHNHPSAIEPYQGAATGVGGILRDIFTMGARPIANLNSLRFGSLQVPRTKYLLAGCVAGIAGYGNCTGVPTIGGEVQFYDCYTGNPLVNAMAVGLLDWDMPLARGSAVGVGNPVLVVGSATGRDGIHGATFASVELTDTSEEDRPAVQVGDPFAEKLLIEACLEAIKTGFIVGIQDMGAAGLTSSACEMADRGGCGIEIDLDLVPRREKAMTPYELMLSESQERMLMVARKGTEGQVIRLFDRWGVKATVVGHVTADSQLRLLQQGQVIADVPASLLADAPVYTPAASRPTYLSKAQSFNPHTLPVPADLTELLGQLLESPNITSKWPVYEQYDHMVQTNTVVPPGADAAVIRIKGTKKAVAFTTDCNPLYCYLDPWTGAAAAVAEASRNLVCSGAKPMAITDCLNFGNPEKPEVFWQFSQCIDGMVSACRTLDIPVISGNVSFYNETNGAAVYPTPVVGMAGLITDLNRLTPMGFQEQGDLIVLLGETLPELGGTQYLKVVHGLEQGTPPTIDLGKECRLQSLILRAIEDGLVASAHDCSEGGLAVTIAEACFAGGHGATVFLLDHMENKAALLFGESQSRVVISVNERQLASLQRLAGAFEVPCQLIGRVSGQSLTIRVSSDPDISGQIVVDAPITELKSRYDQGLLKALA